MLTLEAASERVHDTRSQRMHTGRTGGLRLAEHHADAIDIDGSADHVSGSVLEINVLPGEAQDLGDPPALNEEQRYRCAEPVTGSGHEQRAR